VNPCTIGSLPNRSHEKGGSDLKDPDSNACFKRATPQKRQDKKMKLDIIQSDLKEILDLRDLFLQENNFQIRYNACHERGWTDSYLLKADGAKMGYASLRGKDNHGDRDTVFEFYTIPPFRNKSPQIFQHLLQTCHPSFIECQSNDLLLSSLLFQFAKNISSDVILFDDKSESHLNLENTTFRARNQNDALYEHRSEPEGDFVLEFNSEVLATGGFLLHYNMPFADLYMEVREDFRRKGLGSFLVQELKKQCYLAGRIPAARCNIENMASRATLLKGGLRIAGFMLLGVVK
jgi:GNAT superfamily N-acetyltransferase